MANHPNRARRNAMFIENGYAEIATPAGKITTTRLHEGHYVRVDDGITRGYGRARYPQLCAGANYRGNTLTYTSDDDLARACRAKLYKTRAEFEAAAAALLDE